jgi:hypothetical protein
MGKGFGGKSEMPLAGWSIFNERYELHRRQIGATQKLIT